MPPIVKKMNVQLTLASCFNLFGWILALESTRPAERGRCDRSAPCDQVPVQWEIKLGDTAGTVLPANMSSLSHPLAQRQVHASAARPVSPAGTLPWARRGHPRCGRPHGRPQHAGVAAAVAPTVQRPRGGRWPVPRHASPRRKEEAPGGLAAAQGWWPRRAEALGRSPAKGDASGPGLPIGAGSPWHCS